MKFNTLLTKTALAAAIATVSFGASAGLMTVTNPTVLANEIFGNQSETTIIQMPAMAFTSTTVTSLPVNNVSTIKLTLGGDVIFGEVYDDPAKWAAQNIIVTVGGVLLDASNASVSAGGTSNDNQITINIVNGVGMDLKAINLAGFKVKNLKSSLERVGAGATRWTSAALEVRNNPGATAADFDNTQATNVIASINGITLTSAANGYTTAALTERARINVADEQKKFTTTVGTTSATDFAPGQNSLRLGDLTIQRGALGLLPASKEDGTLFDFTGSDTLTLALEGTNDLTGYGQFYLTTDATCTNANKVGTGSAAAATNTSVPLTLTSTAVLGTPLQLCAQATGTARIAESGIAANLNVKYYSVRYTNSEANADYGRVLRNGCQVSLFNLPNVNAADNAFIRFTNTSELAGQVNAFVWTEDGRQLDLDKEVFASLGKHETVVLHTNAAQQGTGVYLGDALPAFGAETTGRARIVLQGAFPSCEALGLVRGAAGGPLTNMTSTVYSGSSNNTSNTSN